MTKLQPSAAVEELRFTLYRYCLSLTRSAWDAEDLVQETCLRALQVMNGSVAHPNPTAYLLRTAKNIAVDQSRRKKRGELALAAMQRSEAALSRFYSDSAELTDMLGMLIGHLSPLQRTVFLLKELFGFKNGELAAKLSTSEGAVKAALHRARSAVEKLKLGARFRDPDRSGAPDAAVDEGLLQAYVNAVRHGDPQALVVLANAEAHLIDPVEAVSRLGQRFASSDAGSSSSVTMRFAA
ncbi:RNA polymerase sigma factor [Paenibacillus sp. MWE-103]|uniref:RNA polymerase sigma factor n=1 Tax=Paenibacillus artemisiicola TaxID=1172618 RepID=A0ABS3W6T0_9BACL|nr:RNA polymerase sigma factor [Paenibacillus artemisiicola]MBO7744007.1 RNA polymerase sigma factor [Paenibacillus artemisiicola]